MIFTRRITGMILGGAVYLEKLFTPFRKNLYLQT